MKIEWEVVGVILTAIIAIYALIQTSNQIKLSNKQALFERRLVAYSRIAEIQNLVKENRNHLEVENGSDNLFMTIDLHFNWFTNSPELESIYKVINEDMGTTDHKNFLYKLSELDKLSLEAKLVFSSKQAKMLSNFVNDFRNFLFGMYQYQIFFNNLRESSEKWDWTYEEALEKLGGEKYQDKLIEQINTLKISYELVIENSKKIESQIKL